MKVILDTDIGSDIDDAICLAYLLAQPRCELLGITTVTGEAENRAMMASAQCRVAGRKVPIFPGCETPLLVPQDQPHAPQVAALAKWPHDTAFPKNEAVPFLRQTIRQHPGEVTLLTIGPLTNIGVLFTVDPEIPALLQGLVMMCGVFTNWPAGADSLEWNAKGDPHATAIVYRAAVPVHRSIGLDVTRQVQMPAAEVRERFGAPLLRPVLDFAEVWFQRTDRVTFHDPLAATTLFDDAICRFTKGTVDVELQSEKLRGLTHWKAHSLGARHEVALEVEAGRFFEHFFSVFR